MTALGHFVVWVSSASIFFLVISLLKRLSDKKFYYPYSFFISFALVFIMRQILKICIVLHPDLIHLETLRYAIMTLYFVGIQFLFIFFTSIRFEKDNNFKKTIKTFMRILMVVCPYVVIILLSFLGSVPTIEIQQWTPEFFQLMYKSPSPIGNSIYVIVYGIWFFLGTIFLGGILNSTMKTFLKLTYVLLLFGLFFIIMTTGFSSLNFDFSTTFHVITREIFQFLIILFSAAHFWRESEFV